MLIELSPIVNQKLCEIHTEVDNFCPFDMRKSHWFTSGVPLQPPPSNGNGTAGTILNLVRNGRSSSGRDR